MKKEKKEKDKVLHTCKSELTENEYAEMSIHYSSFYKAYLLRGTIKLIILVLIISILFFEKKFISGIILFTILELITALIYKINLKNMAKRSYRQAVKKNNFQTEYMNYLHKDYFIRKNEKINSKVEYKELDKIIETDKNFYLSSGKIVYIFQKYYCELDTISFIRNINKEIYINKLGNERTIKKFDKKKKKNIQRVLDILFVLSMISIFIPIFLEMFPIYISYWITIPVPLISCILGNKYRKEGYDSDKNVTFGTISATVLFILGCLTFIISQQMI